MTHMKVDGRIYDADAIREMEADRERFALAYGLLWHMSIDRRQPNLAVASDARTQISNGLRVREMQGGIVAARNRITQMGFSPDMMLDASVQMLD